MATAVAVRTCLLLEAGYSAGTQYLLENPVDRGDRSLPRAFLHEAHGSIWQLPEVVSLLQRTSGHVVHFSQCRLGAKTQKRTTLAYSSGFDAWMEPLGNLECNHSSHEQMTGGQFDSEVGWNSAESAAYPAEMNLYLAQSMAALRAAAPADRVPAAPPTRAATKPPPREPRESSPAPAAGTPSDPPVVQERAVEPADSAAPPPSPSMSVPVPSSSSDVPASPHALRGPRGGKVWVRQGHSVRESLRPRVALLALSNAFLALTPWGGKANLAHAGAAGTELPLDPRSRAEALSMDAPGWTASMDKEIKNHADNQSWEWVRADSVPRGRRLIKLVWVFKVKRDGKLKSRLCVQGCAQSAGVDYDQTWSGTLRSGSLRLLAGLAASRGMRVHRWDFVSAYLQGSLEDGEVVYCYPPPGYERLDADGHRMICKVVKPIYGMAQAGRRWQRTLFPWLKEFGFTACEHDACMFRMSRPSTNGDDESLIVGVYVDDLAVAFSRDGPGSLYHEYSSSPPSARSSRSRTRASSRTCWASISLSPGGSSLSPRPST